MVETYESQLKKVYYKNGKLKEYNLSLGVNSQINEDRFHENKNGKMVCDVLVCFPDELKKILQEHKEFQSQIQSLENEIAEKDKSIESMTNRLSSIDEEHEKEIKKLTDEYSGRIGKLNEDIHEKDIEKEQVKTKYEREIGDLKESNQKEINGLKLFDEEKHMLIKDHQDELQNLTLYNPESDMKISDHNKEVNGIKDRIVIETIQYNDNITELEKSLSFIGFIKGKHKPIIKQMREGIDDLKLIAQYSESEDDEFVQDIKKGEEK